MDISEILVKSKYLNKLKTSKVDLLKALNNIDKTVLQSLYTELLPNKDFKPVVLLRFLIVNELLQNKPIDEVSINDLKKAIEKREISGYFDFDESYINSLLSYKKSNKGMFPQWKELFLITFPFFYINSEKEQTRQYLDELGQQIITQKGIENARVHSVDFYGPNNYGDDRVWIAIIPKNADNVQMAYQIFININPNGIDGGLYKGNKLKEEKVAVENNYKSFEDYLAGIESLIPQWKQLNNNINFALQKDRIEFEKRIETSDPVCLNTFFQLLDNLIDTLGIPDEGNLVFSTKQDQLSFHVGNRYCLTFKKDNYGFITADDYKISGLKIGNFGGTDKALYYHEAPMQIVLEHFQAIKQAVQFEIVRDNKSHPKENDNSAFRRAAFDTEYRQGLFNYQASKDLFAQPKQNPIMVTNNNLNQILFGPPGTGKTYNTINKALEIIGEGIEGKTRQEIKDLFDAKMKDGQIVFTTFHQSMSYEDFIEGIKPETKNEKVTYKIKDGIFKLIVKQALTEYLEKENSPKTDDSFDNLYNHYIQSILPHKGKKDPIFKSLKGVELVLEDANENSILVKYRWNNNKKIADGQHTYIIPKEKIKKVLWEGIIPDQIKNLKTEIQPLCGSGIVSEFFAVYKAFYEFVIARKGEIETVHFENADLTFEEVKEQFDLLSKEHIKLKKAKPYILIIDEINRGNISQIFGELITLIEDDKRLGKEEALEATLPYSKEKFGVPSNLYIIGTMNTADRSVEALDAALRRRFSFVEMPPKPDLIATDGKLKAENGILRNIDLPLVLRTINKRIEKLLDKDHQIGHSYFMSVTSLSELKATFQNKIIPLLQEYFFGDYGKIGLVLGNDFFRPIEEDKENIFAVFNDYDGSEFSERTIYKIKDLTNISEDEFRKAIDTLLKK